MENIEITNIVSGAEFPGKPFEYPLIVRISTLKAKPIRDEYGPNEKRRMRKNERERKRLANLSEEQRDERRLKRRMRYYVRRDCRIVMDNILDRVSHTLKKENQIRVVEERQPEAFETRARNETVLMDGGSQKISRFVEGELPSPSDTGQAFGKTETFKPRTEDTNATERKSQIDSGDHEHSAGSSVKTPARIKLKTINRLKAKVSYRKYLASMNPEKLYDRKRRKKQRQRERQRKLRAKLQVKQGNNEGKVVTLCKTNVASKSKDRSLPGEEMKDQRSTWRSRLRANRNEKEEKLVTSCTQKFVLLASKPEIAQNISRDRSSYEGRKNERDGKCKSSTTCLSHEILVGATSEEGSQTRFEKTCKTYSANKRSTVAGVRLLAEPKKKGEIILSSCERKVTSKLQIKENILKQLSSDEEPKVGRNENCNDYMDYLKREHFEEVKPEEDSIACFQKTHKTYPAKKRSTITGARLRAEQEIMLSSCEQKVTSRLQLKENVPKDYSSDEGQNVGGNENCKYNTFCLNQENLEETKSEEGSIARFDKTYNTAPAIKRSTITEARLRKNYELNEEKTVTSCMQNAPAKSETEGSILRSILSNEGPKAGGTEKRKYIITQLKKENLEKKKPIKGCLTRLEKVYKICSAKESSATTGASLKPPSDALHLSEIRMEMSDPLSCISKLTECDKADEGPSTKYDVLIKNEPKIDSGCTVDDSTSTPETTFRMSEDPLLESGSEVNGEIFSPFVFIKEERPTESEYHGGEGSEKYPKETINGPPEELECINIKEEFDANERFEDELAGTRVHEEFNNNDRINETLDVSNSLGEECGKIESWTRDTAKSGNEKDEDVRKSTIMSKNVYKKKRLSGFSFSSCVKTKPYVVSTARAHYEQYSVALQTPISYPPRRDQLLSYYHLGDERLFFFTGVHRTKFNVLLSFLTKRRMDRMVIKCLPEEDQLLIFLIQHKHHRAKEYLGHLFGITPAQVRQILTEVACTLKNSLNNVSLWSVARTQCTLQVIIECRDFIAKIKRS